MDFGTLLYNAQKNKDLKKEPIQYYSTKFAPPKKEQKDKSRLSVNVKKFLERKEEEERQKRLEDQKKKEELLALRSKDKKAVKRVNVMLKRTKSANQSVIKDAIDSDNTAVTLVGPAQPDEDDYGYVSQEASAFYSKMMEKYSNMPQQPSKFMLEKRKVNTNLDSTKDRVKAALEKEKEEALAPHRRKRKHNDTDNNASFESSIASAAVDEKPEEKKFKTDKPKLKMPPPINFNDLLKLAEKKQYEPIVIEKKAKEEENPLTKKQRIEVERLREWQERKKGTVRSEIKQPETKVRSEMDSVRRKLKTQPKLESVLTNASDNKDIKLQNHVEPEVRKKIDWGPKHPSAGRMTSSNDKSNSSSSVSNSAPRISVGVKNKNLHEKTLPKNNVNENNKNIYPKGLYNRNKDISENNNTGHDKKLSNKPKDNEKMQKESFGSKQGDYKQKQIPSNDLKPKLFPPSDLKSKKFPPPDLRRKQITSKPLMKKRRIIDEDEEHDSELDDFIDDGPEDEEDYSKYIQEIFGYNKSKYRNMDDDDDIMESSFSQQMKEERISAKLGKLEDLEDMRLEEEHKKQKALMKKGIQKK